MLEENSRAEAKARAFFQKAGNLAKTNNFDYAIDMYIQGLRYMPDALEEGHLPLCEMAFQRSGRGGKKPSVVEKVKHLRGKTALDQMLNAEYLFVKDPNHLPYAEMMLKAALEGDYLKTAGWIANWIFQTNNAAEKPSLQTYLMLKDAYITLGDYEKAVVACQHAVRLKPESKELADEYKNLTAELTMARGKYDGEGDFRKSIKNREEQEKLQSQDSVIKTQDYRLKAIEDARKKIAQHPESSSAIRELADALADMEEDKAENEAIELLENAYKAKSDFSFKEQSGELRIRQIRRNVRKAKKILEEDPSNEQAKVELEKYSALLQKTELEHYKLCMENYPTNLGVKFQYATRLVQNEQYNEAIPLFQQAQRDPRRKIASMNQIGFCFYKKGWLSDAIDVYKRAIETYEIKEDAIGKELRYNLALAYQDSGDNEKALELYRRIAQLDFTYKDVSERVDKLRNTKNEPTSQ